MGAEKVLVIPNILSKIVIKSGRHVRLFCPQQTKGRAAASLMSLCFSKDGLELLDPLPPSPRSTGIIGVHAPPHQFIQCWASNSGFRGY